MVKSILGGRSAFARLSAVALGAALLATLPASPARAQDQSGNKDQQQMAQADQGKPSPILVIWREDVRIGHNGAHEKVEQAYTQLSARTPGARNYLAMKSLSGTPEVWFAEPANSLMELQKEREEAETAPAMIKAQYDQLDAREANEVSGARGVTLIYREDLSLNAKFDLPHSRFVRVNIYRVRPGHDDEFAEAAKMVMATYQKANISDMQWATYSTFSGDMAGVFYVFRPVDSIEKLDPTAQMAQMKAFHQALGEEGGQKLDKMEADGILSVETNVFAFDPKISYAPPAFAAVDSFWAAPTGQMAQVGTSGRTSGMKTAKKEKKQQ